MTQNSECFSDKYRTRDGQEFFTFHFQREQDDEWFFSYCRTSTSTVPPSTEFVPADVCFVGEGLADLREQAADFAESLHRPNHEAIATERHLTAQ